MFCSSHCFSHKNVHLCHTGKDVACTSLRCLSVRRRKKEVNQCLLLGGIERGGEGRYQLEHRRQPERMGVPEYLDNREKGTGTPVVEEGYKSLCILERGVPPQ